MCRSVSASNITGRLSGGHDPHRGRLHLAQEEDIPGDGNPGGLPPLHGLHPEGLPLLPQTHRPGAIGKGHGCRVPLRPSRYSRRWQHTSLAFENQKEIKFHGRESHVSDVCNHGN